MKQNKLWFTPFVLLLIIFMIVGCSQQGNSTAKDSSNSAEKQPNKEGSNDDIVELDMFVDHSWWPLKDFSGEIPEEITTKTGVKLNITVATDEKQLPLMIASGDLPDLVYTSNEFQRLSDPNLSYPWDELIKEYAPDFSLHPDKIGANTASDGKFYTIRNNFSPEDEWAEHEGKALISGPGLALRKDILEELGDPKIESLEDLDHVLGMVKEKHPDMTPLVFAITPTWTKGYFATQFGAAIDGFVEKDGELMHALRQPELLEMYKYMNTLYRNGYILAENYAYKSEDQAKQLVTGGKAFAYSWMTNSADRLNAEIEDKDFTFVQLSNMLTEDAKSYQYNTGWSGVFITKNNKNPEASIKFMEYLFSDEGNKTAFWGVEGKDWNWNDEGYPVFTFDKQDQKLQQQKGSYWWGLLSGSAVSEALFNYQPDSETTKAQEVFTSIAEWKPAVGLVEPKADSKEQVIATNIENMITNEEAKVFLAKSDEEAEKAFNNMVKQAEKIGLEELEKWANEKYKKVKGAFE